MTLRQAERDASRTERPAAQTVPHAKLHSFDAVETDFFGAILTGVGLELSCRRNLCRYSVSYG